METLIQQPLVSIVTPCYNAGHTIRQTISSVLDQTYQNWEMIIVDDCSTDNSRDIIQEYAKKDGRIHLLTTTHPSGSPTTPRNVALSRAQGQFVAFLDADDLWMPNKLEIQIDYMLRNKCPFCYADYEKMTAEGKRSGRFVLLKKSTSYWDMLESNSVPCLTVVIERAVIGNLRFREVPQEDMVFWLELMKRKDIVAQNVGEVLAIYRGSRHSRSSNKIRMIRKQWYVLRHVEKVKRIPSLYFMAAYLIQGTLKYMK